jgi:hypothetical protein
MDQETISPGRRRGTGVADEAIAAADDVPLDR